MRQNFELKESLVPVKRAWNILRGRDTWQSVQLQCRQIHLGSEHARWCVCPTQLTPQSIVYSFGVGEEISFDLEVICQFGVCVHAFDPTPRSIQWVRTQAVPAEFVFHEYGVADFDGICQFTPPENPGYVSHSMIRKNDSRRGRKIQNTHDDRPRGLGEFRRVHRAGALSGGVRPAHQDSRRLEASHGTAPAGHPWEYTAHDRRRVPPGARSAPGGRDPWKTRRAGLSKLLCGPAVYRERNRRLPFHRRQGMRGRDSVRRAFEIPQALVAAVSLYEPCFQGSDSLARTAGSHPEWRFDRWGAGASAVPLLRASTVIRMPCNQAPK